MFERYPAILAIIDGTMNSALYQNILKENVRLSVCDLKLKHTWVMQQDNDPKHTSQSNSEWLKKNKINVFEWPSQNLIEILWHDLKHSFHSWKPSNEAEFHVVPGRFGQLFSLSKLHFYIYFMLMSIPLKGDCCFLDTSCSLISLSLFTSSQSPSLTLFLCSISPLLV